MGILALRFDSDAVDVDTTDLALRVVLADGRELSAPLAWFPRLRDATPQQRRHWRLIGGGQGIRWPDIDEDIAVATLLRLRLAGWGAVRCNGGAVKNAYHRRLIN